MSKKQKKGVGVELVGSPDALIKRLIKDQGEEQWVTEEITNGGPAHKQVLSALLLKRLYTLVKTLEKKLGTAFELQKGYEVESFTHDDERVTMPIALPLNAGTRADKQRIVATVAAAPLHELLVYTLCLQVIEWGIKHAAAGGND